ncbi:MULTISPECIES: hypothetical protein [unclassified Synechocystis]|nr:MULTISPECIES: hypothetical protein [unclassified Synechocystis]UOO12594.1 hypothetical protein MT986_04820 [Synechocystis sp. PCC 6803]
MTLTLWKRFQSSASNPLISPCDPTELDILARTTLLSPWQFYRYVCNICQQNGHERLYFGHLPCIFCDYLPEPLLLAFFDRLAESVGRSPQPFPKTTLHLQSLQGTLELRISHAGSGMIGQVVRLDITYREKTHSWAFKAFFEPDFVWQHGVWSEIPVGIYLRSQHVTRDVAQFHAAGLTWMLCEWIEPDDCPKTRPGRSYDSLAQQQQLTPLNPLNYANYSRHGIRLDLGGIQKIYWGRRIRDFAYTLVFYHRRVHREGWRFLSPYLNCWTLRYLLARVKWLLFLRRPTCAFEQKVTVSDEKPSRQGPQDS